MMVSQRVRRGVSTLILLALVVLPSGEASQVWGQFEDGLALEVETAVALREHAGFREDVEAFLSKRTPMWSDSWTCETS